MASWGIKVFQWRWSIFGLQTLFQRGREMECDLSSLHLLADAASLVSEGQPCLVPSIFDRDDGKKVTVVTATTFGPLGVGWIVRKKRSPRARGLTFHAQKLSSDPVGVVGQKNKQENLRGVAENCKKRTRAFDSTETQEKSEEREGTRFLISSSLHLLADAASLVSEGKLCVAPSIFDRDDGKKVTVVTTTTFGPMGVGWIVRKKRSPRARGLTFHAQKSSSGPVFVVVQKKKQENLRGVAENWKKRLRAFGPSETQESDRVSKKPKKTQKKILGDLIGPSELPTIFMDEVLEMQGRDARLVVEKELSATDMNPSQSRLSIPKSQVLTEFLSNQEIITLNSKEGIKVSLIGPCLEIHHGLQLKKWSCGSKTFSYVLTKRWNAVAHPYKPNGLEKNGIVQLWSFRVGGNLCFCLTKVEAPIQGNGKPGSA